MDLVSIVITTYKRKDELKKAICSVLAQTYNNIEVIVIDDNADTSISHAVQEIVQDFGDSRVSYWKNEHNLGGALSRNVGLKFSKGKYIAFLDDDDEYMPDKIELQVDKFKTSKYKNLGLVYGYTEAVDADGNVLTVYRNKVEGNFVYEAMENTIAATSQWLCLKEAVDAIGGFRDVPCKQDTTFLIDVALAGYQIDYVPKILSKYYELNIERISGFGPKRIKGEEILRNTIRENYSNLTSNEKKKIEWNIGFRIYDLYLNNFMLKKAIHEQKQLLENAESVYQKCRVIIYMPYKLMRKLSGNTVRKFRKLRLEIFKK